MAPNIELAAALIDAVERRHLAAGDSLWPTPQIADWSTWLRRLYSERLRDDADGPRCLSELEERELWRSVVRDSGTGGEFLNPDGAARAGQRARRAMADHGIPPRALTLHDDDETRVFAGWNRQFDERCRELHCVASHELPGRIAPAANLVRWIESPLWRPAARDWLKRFAGEPIRPPMPRATATATLVIADGSSDELAIMADWARRELGRREDFRAWVCIPDLAQRRAEVEDAFDAALAPERFSLVERPGPPAYALAGGTALADYAPVRTALQGLAAALGPISFPTFSALLRLPDLQASRAETSAAAALDVALRTHGPYEAPLSTWLARCEGLVAEERAPAPAALARLRRMLTLLDPGKPRALSRWVTTWLEAFEAGPWAERARWSSSEFQAATRFGELLGALASADALFGPHSATAAVSLLRRAALDTAFQPRTGVPPIGVSSQIMDPWLEYDALWIAGCSAGRWPPPPAPLPLLPIGVQIEYGMLPATAAGQWELARDLQNRWAQRSPCNFFSCVSSAGRESAAVSPLLPPAAEWRAAPAQPQPHWHALAAHVPTLQRLAETHAPPFAAGEPLRGVGTLRSQARCAFRGFAETRLRAEPLEQPVPGFTASERGQILHRALQLVWSELRSFAVLAMTPRAQRREIIEQAVDGALVERCARRDPGPRWRMRERARLVPLLDTWLDGELERAPFEVLHLEHDVERVRVGGLDFTLRIDRIDRLSAGGRVLIDYKSGHAQRDWCGERPENPQLPLYAVLQPEDLVAVAYGQVNASSCKFIAETARSDVFKRKQKASNLEGLADFPTLVHVWSQRVSALAAEFAAGVATVTPTLKACRTCSLQPLCRIPATPEPEEAEHG